MCLFACVSDAVVTSLAGSGSNTFANGVGTQASFNNPQGVAVNASGTVFVADYHNHRIRAILLTGGTSGASACSSACIAVVLRLRLTCTVSSSTCRDCCRGRYVCMCSVYVCVRVRVRVRVCVCVCVSVRPFFCEFSSVFFFARLFGLFVCFDWVSVCMCALCFCVRLFVFVCL